jgi:ABC-type oligopeptide transport system ATPase subunit
MVGLTGPSSSGKTYTGLRIATGIQSIYGGDIFVVDTEQRRSLHYADKFKFKHVDFQAPYSSLDYLEALRYCKKQGAGVVMIDSCSHEHDGPGGMLEQHETELTRMAGNDFGKRDRMSMLAWAKPKTARRQLITAITTELAMPVIFCFRAKTGTKPAPRGAASRDPIEMGFTSIGADEWLFEMAVNMLFLPGADGVPTWESNKPGERLAIKCPTQFRWMRDLSGPITEDIGVRLAQWARGGVSTPVSGKATPRPAEPAHAAPDAPTDLPSELSDYADALQIEIEVAKDSIVLGQYINQQIKTEEWGRLREADLKRSRALYELAVKRIGELKVAA